MRGGKRPGAGRKKGAPNKSSAAREFAAQASGETPADVMLGAMREFWRLAKESTNARKRSEHIGAAAAIAKDAAPFFHAKRVSTAMPSAIDLPKIETTADTVKAMSFAIEQMAAGKITPSQLMELRAAIGEMRKAIELEDIRREMRDLEKQVQTVRRD
jgi:hypothetical protein